MKTPQHHFYRGWLAALAVFALAGATGALLRFGLLYGFPTGLYFSNVRHAHSHLMYFGWVTPALMALVAVNLPAVMERPLPTTQRWPMWLALGCGLLAYLPFLLYGYRPALIGGRALPLSVMAAGLNIVSWYLFATLYWRATRGAPRNAPLRLWDAALLLLLLATLGGWGLPALTFLDVQNTFLSLAFTHLFLDAFAYGWFLLGLLGLATVPQPHLAGRRALGRSIGLCAAGAPLVFLLNMPPHLVSAPLRAVGGLGGLLLALGLLSCGWLLWPGAARRWRWSLGFAGLTAAALLVTVIPAAAQWAVGAGLRVPFLHWLLLGCVTLGLLAAAEEAWGQLAGAEGLRAAVVALLLTLMPLTDLWPAALHGGWVLHLAAWGALLPVLAALGILAVARWRGVGVGNRTWMHAD